MSDDFFRPTLTYPGGAYSATQVRLYGLLPDSMPCGILYPGQKPIFKTNGGGLEVAVSVTTGDQKLDEKFGKVAQDYFGSQGDSKLQQAEQFTKFLKSDAAKTLESPVAFYTQISIEMRKFGKVAFSAMITKDEALDQQKVISCGIIVGYSYEGHTYDLAKPKIMVIPALPEPAIPLDDSGYDKKPPGQYAVWLVDKLDECMEFELSQGFVEQIVLDANLPGKRSPNMYVGRMMMGHRSGRLTE